MRSRKFNIILQIKGNASIQEIATIIKDELKYIKYRGIKVEALAITEVKK